MSVWGAAATFMVFPSPADGGGAIPAFGHKGVLPESAFNQLWSGFVGTLPNSSTCTPRLNITVSDTYLIGRDGFLAFSRGIDRSLCNANAWFVSAMRIDPCRVRSMQPNLTESDLNICSLDGKFSEVRLVLQPVGQHDRGYYFPDAALHVSFSARDMKATSQRWRRALTANQNPRRTLSAEDVQSILHDLKENDAAVMFADAGQARWTFARAEPVSGGWKKVPLAHGGLHESISDAEISGQTTRTPTKSTLQSQSLSEIFDPLKTHPLKGSCIECHLADSQRPARAFRQLGWGLGGEKIVSRRTVEESRFSAAELNVLWRGRLDR